MVDIMVVELTPRRVKTTAKAKHQRNIQRHSNLGRSRPSMPLADLPALRTDRHLFFLGGEGFNPPLDFRVSRCSSG